ncbi:MAG: ABC transporter ATP-binding protein [Oscillospiraceae bacterium]|nr:ABC transporter ATP-binding protein [Oscillospiraceae bacterium]
MGKQPIISFKDFSFRYLSQAEETLHNINLNIYEGEKICIIGPSGSGKSTLGHCLNGLIPFSYKGEAKGTLEVCGLKTLDQTIFKMSKMIGTVLQDSDGQFIGLSVGEDIAFVLENDCVHIDEMKKRVSDVSKMVDMDKFLLLMPHELSGGQKQRVALAGVMINDVDILLFDEPLANLDPATGKSAIEIIDDIHKNTNKTIIIIEHRLEDVLHRSIDRIIVFNDGCIIADKPPGELLCSDILKNIGIREPLYLTALSYAGIDFKKEDNPEDIDKLEIKNGKERLISWQKSIEIIEDKRDYPSALKLSNVSFSYDGKKDIVSDINFDIKEGEMVSIVGKNGAGKSTLTKLICGFEKLDKGEILFNGKSVLNMSISERASYVGLVMQNPNMMISLPKIYDEVALGLKLRNFSEDDIKSRVEKALSVCGLLPFIDWPIQALSYGQKKRVTIASILVLQPKIIILDEPTAGQDYRHYSEMMEFLKKLNEEGNTVILITHDMHLMLEYTYRSIVLCDGKKLADAPSYKILTDENVIKEANLKETSLYVLAKRVGIKDPTAFVQSFINYKKGAK